MHFLEIYESQDEYASHDEYNNYAPIYKYTMEIFQKHTDDLYLEMNMLSNILRCISRRNLFVTLLPFSLQKIGLTTSPLFSYIAKNHQLLCLRLTILY